MVYLSSAGLARLSWKKVCEMDVVVVVVAVVVVVVVGAAAAAAAAAVQELVRR